ncbi:hypothetical protein BpHYR1_020625 [Brachionus plicatilis]|uniref:Uncharacterized protein n=1 Tax=Brachionus plicatilis TaxID=10195 RepID=A0A3M7RSF1_BRAPC|nr:hypothetical protein BpHYR1_020625 [Brachionus plicatilis]
MSNTYKVSFILMRQPNETKQRSGPKSIVNEDDENQTDYDYGSAPKNPTTNLMKRKLENEENKLSAFNKIENEKKKFKIKELLKIYLIKFFIYNLPLNTINYYIENDQRSFSRYPINKDI